MVLDWGGQRCWVSCCVIMTNIVEMLLNGREGLECIIRTDFARLELCSRG